MTLKTGVLIPYWIQDILKRNSLPFSACLDYEQISKLLSIEDLATFQALQSDKYFKLITTINQYGIGDNLWIKNINNSASSQELIKSLELVLMLSNDNSISANIDAKLFNKELCGYEYKDAFNIYDLTPDKFGIVIYPGYFSFNTNDIDRHRALLEEIIEMLYKYGSFHEVANTEYFKGYLEILAKK